MTDPKDRQAPERVTLTPMQLAALELACEQNVMMRPEGDDMVRAFRCLHNAGYLRRQPTANGVFWQATIAGHRAIRHQWEGDSTDG